MIEDKKKIHVGKTKFISENLIFPQRDHVAGEIYT